MPLDEEIRRMLEGVLRSQGPLHLDAVEWERDERRYEIVVRARFLADNGLEYFTEARINEGELDYRDWSLFRYGRSGGFSLHHMWSRMAEDFRMQEAAHARTEALRTLAQSAPNARAYGQLLHEVSRLDEHVRQHHSWNVWDAVEIPRTTDFGTATEISMRQERLRRHQEHAMEQMARRYDDIARSFLGRVETTQTSSSEQPGTLTAEDLRRAIEALAQNDTAPRRRPGMQYHGMDVGVDLALGPNEMAMMCVSRPIGRVMEFVALGRLDWYGKVGTPQAQAKGKALLIEHLTPEQKQEYETTKAFTVVGQSGKKYRIKEGRQMNIDVLDENGNRASGVCFLPEGQLVDGDCMLAQKIALETCEDQALAVANKFP